MEQQPNPHTFFPQSSAYEWDYTMAMDPKSFLPFPNLG